jgi:uncharacterized RDD family membrane protein YckC
MRRGGFALAAADAASAPAPEADAKARREFVTPEGVDLRLRIGEASERAAAFLLDAVIIMGGMLALTLLAVLAFAGAGDRAGQAGEWILVIWLLGSFCARNLYFIAFELGPRAATPGKRALGLRVAARRGGRLTADSIFARNAMREIEVYLPLTFLLARGRDVDAWMILMGVIWCGVFALFPLFNRDRLRIGDLVAGTWVVKSAKRRLLPDLAERGTGDQRFAFTQAQVDAYGVKELHVLEDVLRRNNLATVAAVAERIRNKIGWSRAEDEADGAFLDAYYAALRRRLETRMLLGRRRKDKFDVG